MKIYFLLLLLNLIISYNNDGIDCKKYVKNEARLFFESENEVEAERNEKYSECFIYDYTGQEYHYINASTKLFIIVIIQIQI